MIAPRDAPIPPTRDDGQVSSRRYRRDDVLREPGTGQRLVVLAVGREAYFVWRLDEDSAEAEPAEMAWAFEGCEDVARLVERSAEH